MYLFIYHCCYYLLQAEDLLDDILSFESSSLADSLKLDGTYGGGGSANGGTNGSNSDLIIKQEPSNITDAEMHALAKDRQKKDNHNMSTCLLKTISTCIVFFVFFMTHLHCMRKLVLHNI